MVMISVWLFLGFVLGALTVIAVEGIVILYLIRRLAHLNKSSDAVVPNNHPQNRHDPRQCLSSLCDKQGVIWVLEPEKHPKIPLPSEQTRKRDIVEVFPLRKRATVKDRVLTVTEEDGSLTKIMLKGCNVVAVSATSMHTRKWAKRYPIKVESKNGVLYQGSKVLYIYAETSFEKESWCKALHLASVDKKEKLLWFSELNDEFGGYLKLLSEAYPSLFKPSVVYEGAPLDKANRFDEPPSKVRQFWRKLSKRNSLASLDEKKVADKSHHFHDSATVPIITKIGNPGKMQNDSEEENPSLSSIASTRSGSSINGPETSDAETAEKTLFDEGTFCLNLLVSRLFFDIKSNVDIKTAVKARIQRSLSNIRLPSFIGEVTCIDLVPGNLPPYIHGMRAVPTDMNDVLAMEMDIEYSGGVVLDIEVRLEVGELDSHNDMVDHNVDSSSVDTTDLFEDFKHLQEDLKLSDVKNDPLEQKNAGDLKHELQQNSRIGASTAGSGSRWKSILNSVAKHVSQVPLTLSIRVAALRGTLQLHIKPPPSDQLWLGFSNMPDIQFQLESSVKDHKLTNGHIASFLINRFKASIRDTLVIPNFETVSVPWMLAEKDDWIPCNAAPLIWLNRDSLPDTSNDSRDIRTEDRPQESKHGKQNRHDTAKQSVNEESGQVVPSTTLRRSSSETGVVAHDLKMPLLQNEETRDLVVHGNPEGQLPSTSRYISLREQTNSVEDNDSMSKKPPLGRKARMFDLGKKVGEKLEEKRRSIEEKSRNIVEKMRGP